MESKTSKGQMSWWQLSLLGVGCTLGTGFFLGTSMAIAKSGPAVLIPFILAAIGTYIVYDALVNMSVANPDKGSFRTYAKQAFGNWAGFSNGWVYLISELLIMGSQLMALGIFTRFWFPSIPLWMTASGFGALGLLIILTGMKGFEKFQNVFGAMKAAAVVMFIVVAAILMLKGMNSEPRQVDVILANFQGFFSEGVKGVWLGLLYAFFAFGGIEVMGLLVIDLKDPHQAPKAGKVMIVILTTIYVIALVCALALVHWASFTIDESPFITALANFNIPFVADIITGILIIAGFSTMVASLYAVVTILTALAEDHDAPAILAKKGKMKVPLPAFLFLTGGLIITITIGFLIPEKIFEYLITAAGLMLIYNWLFILVTYAKLMTLTKWQHVKNIVGMLLIAVTVSGTLGEKTSRLGFYISFLFIVFIALATLIVMKKRSNHRSV
ncbi:amino acid permease [Lysinibacillus sphaericus]|uniref:Amino acid permease n=1 Tax=Lysinibacillus sphaericus TaxID=1421 RepID=A0A2S0K277_LYSSH|nr:amino acid permease [Lysinibacillus sphaericus]AVK97472.1 transporter [Lysinibacillus sphaericus]MED4546011.1 amino acid permease [Lysinibacillus sphaericus]TKI16205.1 amino acid permease [Lysinibacillus sphaericus]SUV16623.1 amino acid permease [Lysinibacillus sphaericus]GEC84224.1 putative transporter YcgH [Lysinibacillus sphaericus]